MPKRSLNAGNNDGKRIEQLNRAVEKMFARTDGAAPKVAAEIAPLVRIAADLRDMPREQFRTRLRNAILKGELPKERTLMTIVIENAAAVHQSAMPNLTFKDTAKAIEFYGRALGAEETFRFETGGQIPHAEIKIGDTVFSLSDEWEAGGRLSAETLGSSPVTFRVFTKDVDALAARAVAEGMTVSMPIKDQFYGYREGRFEDPFGYSWSLVTVKEEMSVEEMHRRLEGETVGPEGGRMPGAAKSGVNPVPRGFHMVTPYIVTPDGDAMLDFAKNAFNAEIILRATGGGAGGIHGVVRIGDTMLMMGGGISGKPFAAEPKLTALHVYVEDTDATYRKALDAGATSIGAPQDHEYGERGASVKDPFGNFWYIATHKDEGYVPKGLHNVNVYMHPLRAEPVIGFLKRAFGAKEIAKYASPDGVVHHAEIQVRDSVVEMGEAHGPYQPMPSMFYVYSADCDALYHRALAAGAKSLHELTDQPYGDRNGAVTDPFGNIWYVATHVKDVTP
jgi:PhnB protein